MPLLFTARARFGKEPVGRVTNALTVFDAL